MSADISKTFDVLILYNSSRFEMILSVLNLNNEITSQNRLPKVRLCTSEISERGHDRKDVSRFIHVLGSDRRAKATWVRVTGFAQIATEHVSNGSWLLVSRRARDQ